MQAEEYIVCVRRADVEVVTSKPLVALQVLDIVRLEVIVRQVVELGVRGSQCVDAGRHRFYFVHLICFLVCLGHLTY